MIFKQGNITASPSIEDMIRIEQFAGYHVLADFCRCGVIESGIAAIEKRRVLLL